MIPFCRPTIGDEEIGAVARVLKSGWLAAGEQTAAFEHEFAEYVGVNYAIFTNSCTSALKIAYKVSPTKIVGGHTYVVVPRNTFCATYSAAEEMGLEWDYYDSQPKLSATSSSHRINMHYGSIKDETPCLIEDSAHRIEPHDPLVGKIRCYSFYVTKNMTTGAGGMLVTNDKEIYEQCRLYWRDGLSASTYKRQHGQFLYAVQAMAGGYDGNDLGAAIGREQLKKLPAFTTQRNQLVQRYNEAFGQHWTGNHLYPFFVDSSNHLQSLFEYLRDRAIATGYHYPESDGSIRQDWLALSLPLYPLLQEDEQAYIIESVKDWQSLANS